MKFGSTAKVLAERKLKYYRIPECLPHGHHRHQPSRSSKCKTQRIVIAAHVVQHLGHQKQRKDSHRSHGAQTRRMHAEVLRWCDSIVIISTCACSAQLPEILGLLGGSAWIRAGCLQRTACEPAALPADPWGGRGGPANNLVPSSEAPTASCCRIMGGICPAGAGYQRSVPRLPSLELWEYDGGGMGVPWCLKVTELAATGIS